MDQKNEQPSEMPEQICASFSLLDFKWEYKSVTFTSFDAGVETAFNELGQEEWELAGILSEIRQHVALFKRPLKIAMIDNNK